MLRKKIQIIPEEMIIKCGQFELISKDGSTHNTEVFIDGKKFKEFPLSKITVVIDAQNDLPKIILKTIPLKNKEKENED